MAKVKYDVKGVEPGQDFSEPIPVGVYKARITEAEEKVSESSGNDMIALTLEVSSGDHKGRNLWDYVTLTESTQWKVRQLVDALNLPERGTLDTAKIVGEQVQVRVKHEVDDRKEVTEGNGGKPVVRSRVGSLLPMPDGAVVEEEAEEEEADDGDEGAGEDYTYADLEEMDLDDLKEVIESEELSVRVTSKSKPETVLAKVAEALGVEPEEEEPEEEDEDEEELDWSELKEYGRVDMEALIEDNELDVTFNKRTSDDTLRERIAEELGIEAPESGDDDEEEAPDYSDWSIADLKNELKERGIRPVGSKKALVRKLEKSDEADGDGDPF